MSMKQLDKVVAYLTEPASYTQDLVKYVHENIGLKYRFLQRKTKHSNEQLNSVYLSEMSFFQKLTFLKKDFNTHDVIIFNGYNRIEFWYLWFFQLFTAKKRRFLFESDTQLRVPVNIFKRAIKSVVLNYLFKKKYVFGLAGGEYLHKEHFTYYGMKEERVFFLPMVSDTRSYKGMPKQYSEPFSLLFVGRFVSLKNLDFLIEEFTSSYKNNPTIKLTLVGDGPLKKSLEEKYSQYSNVHFTGEKYNEDLVKEYRSSHALVLASYKEQWGLVLNEAMAAGLPVLANHNVGAANDLIVNRDTGFVFNYKNNGDFIEKLELLRKPKTYESFSKNAFDLLNNYWNFDLYKKQLLLAIEKMKNA